MSNLNVSISLIIVVVIVLWLLIVLDEGIKNGSKIFLVFSLCFIVIAFIVILSFFTISYTLHLSLGI